MAKFDWGFDILNKETARTDCAIQVLCTRTNTVAEFALGQHPTAAWGDLIESNMTPQREHDAEAALSTWGWI